MPSHLLIRRLNKPRSVSTHSAPSDGMSLWLRSDAGLTIDETGTPSVSTWRDQSPNERSVNQSSKAAQPIVTADGITFDGVNDQLTVFMPLIRHYFAVFKNTGSVFSNTFGGIINPTTTTSSARLGVFEPNQTFFHSNLFPASVRKNGIQLSSPFNLSPVNVPMVLSIVTAATSSPGSYRLAGMGSVNHNALSVQELICYATQLSADSVTQTETYLMQKYGIGA